MTAVIDVSFIEQMPSNTELSRSRGREPSDKAQEQEVFHSRGKQKPQRLSAQVKSYAP